MKTVRQLSTAVLVLISAIALYIGINMLLDPTGSSLGIPFYLLNGTMFTDYVVPGWVLIIALGMFGTFTIYVINRRYKWYSIVIIVEGAIVMLCAVAQMAIFGDEFFLQYFFLMTGLGLIALGALQYQMRKQPK